MSVSSEQSQLTIRNLGAGGPRLLKYERKTRSHSNRESQFRGGSFRKSVLGKEKEGKSGNKEKKA